MAGFSHRSPVMFQHCDPAGIVFYPRYFEMINAVVETFFDTAIGWSFHQMHSVDRVGIPTGKIEAEFHAPSRLGDDLDWVLVFEKIGRASAAYVLRAYCGDEARLTAKGTLVMVDLDRMTSRRWPEAIRQKLETFLEVHS